MCKVTCERANDGKDNGVDESMDLGNGDLSIWRKFESFVIWGYAC